MWYLLIRDVIDAQNICIYQPPTEVDDEASAEHVRILAEAMPFSIIGSTEAVQTPDGRVKGPRVAFVRRMVLLEPYHADNHG
jgi:septin family protein